MLPVFDVLPAPVKLPVRVGATPKDILISVSLNVKYVYYLLYRTRSK